MECPCIIDKKIAFHWNSVQEQQRRLLKIVNKVAVVPAIDLWYDDAIHISGASQHRLGRRLARAMMVLTNGRKYGKAPIDLKSVKTVVNKFNATVDIEVYFANVEEALRADGKPCGFSIVNTDGRVCDCIYRVDIKGDLAILHTNLMPAQAPGFVLHYGRSLVTYCNITDAVDRALPVFGPVKVPKIK
jgi:hypothetical protein